MTTRPPRAEEIGAEGARPRAQLLVAVIRDDEVIGSTTNVPGTSRRTIVCSVCARTERDGPPRERSAASDSPAVVDPAMVGPPA